METPVQKRPNHGRSDMREIADASGFMYKNRFDKFFKPHAGVNPSAFRRNFKWAAQT